MVLQLIFSASLLAIAVSCNRTVEVVENGPVADTAMVRVDTFEVQAPSANEIFVRHLGDSLAPDSTGTTHFRIQFRKAGATAKTFSYSIPFQSERGSWSMSNEVFTNSDGGSIDKRFVILTNGFEACGYPQYSLMFYCGEDIELIDRWVSVSDGGLGTWREFFPIFADGKVNEFRHRMVSSESVEGPAGTSLVEITYRDSTVMRQLGTKWLREVITLPDVRYRTEVISETDYYQ